MAALKLRLLALIFFGVVLIPVAALPKGSEKAEKPQKSTPASSPAASLCEEEIVRLWKEEKGKVERLEMREYIFGVVAAECPMTYKDEAIKAQIVAAATYTRYLIEQNRNADYDASTDASICQAYEARAEAIKKWGDEASAYEKRLEGLLDEVLGVTITYNDEPIFAAYHAISSGETEDAENVWGNEVAYLSSVPSVSDKLAEGYLMEGRLTMEQTDAALEHLGITARDLLSAKLEESPRGNVISAEIGGERISGARLVAALGLRSPNFRMQEEKGSIVFTTKGYGHQVGMSQSGANFMAKQGADYKEILEHYYSGVKLKSAK